MDDQPTEHIPNPALLVLAADARRLADALEALAGPPVKFRAHSPVESRRRREAKRLEAKRLDAERLEAERLAERRRGEPLSQP